MPKKKLNPISKSISFFLILILTSQIFFWGPFVYLYRVKEYLPLSKIAEILAQSDKKLIYGSALNEFSGAVQWYLLKHRPKADVFVLGSSRVLKYHESFFSVPMANLGQNMSRLNDALSFLPLIQKQNPKIVIMGLDFWWFNSSTELPFLETKREPPFDAAPKATLADLKTFWGWIFSGSLSPFQVLKVSVLGAQDLGVSGYSKQGFAKDGSYYDLRLITGEKKADDRRFEVIREHLRKGSRPFEAGVYNEKFIEKVERIIEAYKRAGIHLVTFFTPLPPLVLRDVKQHPEVYGYISQSKEKLNQKKIPIYDFLDVESLGSNDCEFTDGLHGGEIVSMRILQVIAEKDTKLRHALNYDFIEKSIQKYTGRAFLPDPEISTKPEIDFLELGCKK